MRTIEAHSRFLTLVLLAFTAVAARAEVRLPKIFSSHMVLQRDQPIHIWGFSDPAEKVSASLSGANRSTIGDSLGHWSLYLPAQSAGGPFRLTISGSNKIVLEDILIGDVWFASGQSNMEMPLNGFPKSAFVQNSAEEIKNANHSNLRLLLIHRTATQYPQNDFQGDVAWTTCTPETAAKFSAVAYFFGRDIQSKENVPIGLIDSTWGGTPAEAWVSLDGLSADAGLMPVFASWARMADAQPNSHSGRAAPDSWDPSWLFNGMIAPALHFGIKGVIWYQGESNSKLDRAPMYHRVFSSLIGDWRSRWGEGNFPFLFAQISSFKSNPTEDWGTIRDAQRRTLSAANTGMAVTLDVGNPDNVHPADKQTVGARLALAARAIAYHENVEYSGPLFRETTTENGGIRIWFTHVDHGLVAKGGALQGFEIAGDDGRFVPAPAQIDGESVVVSTPDMPAPKYVRYAWQNAPDANLYNSAGLPASTFTSEQRP
ncbi:MAG TPA: sialate O-acetylesterase [Bryobacteraceae bacterium]|jgi:sialate O-acetylesterase|nr:sialate O-acetylesterase [Bryobacteraceae bacterium]